MKQNRLIRKTLVTSALITLCISANGQEDAEDLQLVSTANAKSESVEPVMWLPGNVISRLDAAISSEQSGQLLFLTEIGSTVTEGAVVAKLDDRALQLELAQLQAEQRQLEASVAYLQKQQQRMEQLAQNYSTAASEIDRNQRDLSVAKDQLVAMGLRIDQVALNLEKTQIKAPFDGVVNAHFVSIGELIPVSRPLLQLVNTNSLDIQVDAPLSISNFVTQVDQAQVKWDHGLEVLPIRTWSSAGQQSSRTFDLRLDASGLGLFAGSAVQVSLPKSEAITSVMVPRDALIIREKESFVFTVDPQNTAHKVNVLIGQGIADWVSVVGNVTSGDQIIIRGGERLQDGQSVRIDNQLALNTEQADGMTITSTN